MGRMSCDTCGGAHYGFFYIFLRVRRARARLSSLRGAADLTESLPAAGEPGVRKLRPCRLGPSTLETRRVRRPCASAAGAASTREQHRASYPCCASDDRIIDGCASDDPIIGNVLRGDKAADRHNTVSIRKLMTQLGRRRILYHDVTYVDGPPCPGFCCWGFVSRVQTRAKRPLL